MNIEKVIYKKDQWVTKGEGNPEKILLLNKEKDIIYFPEYSKPYSFSKDTEVFEITLGEKIKSSTQPDNLASPFSLTGDACFYNFMARIIKVSGKQEFYNKRGKDILWLVSGEIYLEKDNEEKVKIGNSPIIIREKEINYNIAGEGEVFLLKI